MRDRGGVAKRRDHLSSDLVMLTHLEWTGSLSLETGKSVQSVLNLAAVKTRQRGKIVARAT